MQVDAPTCHKYAKEAPELLAAVADAGGPAARMRRDDTDYCVKLEDGLCGIHKRYGAEYLGDACYFYPRVTRRLGDQVIMTATLSCPEIARLSLFGAEPIALAPGFATRLPVETKDYLPEGLSAAQALAIHQAFLEAVAGAPSPEEGFACVISVANSLSRLPATSWPEAVPFYMKSAATGSVPAEENLEDPFNLLHALCGLIAATHLPRNPRLSTTIAAMERALATTLDWSSVAISLTPGSKDRLAVMREHWRLEHAPAHRNMFTRWLQFQLSSCLFPFAGLGANPAERITILGVRFATFKLAVMCENANVSWRLPGAPPPPDASIAHSALPQEIVVRIAQSLARVLDHLGDPDFSLRIYHEAGWTRETRLRGLVAF